MIGSQDIRISCPGSSFCRTIIKDESIIEFIDNQDIKTKYQQLIIKSFIQSNPILKWCPAPDCNYVIQIQSHVQAIQVECICGYEFCFQCSQPFHDPAIVSCDLMEKWLSNLPPTENDSKNVAYFLKNVKNCPKCHIPIEKSSGCNTVTCTNAACRTKFCYNSTKKSKEMFQKSTFSNHDKYLYHKRSMNLEKKWKNNVKKNP